MRAVLPSELRENVYKHIFDTTNPIVVPRLDKVKSVTPINRIHCGVKREQSSTKQDPMDPFAFDYYFSPAIMGLPTSIDIQDLAFRKNPFYFRGCRNSPKVTDFLDLKVQSGKHIRDLVRHLRVYLRCEDFERDVIYETQVVPPTTIKVSASIIQTMDEPATYAQYRSRLDGLQTLNYANHKIVLEVCVFYKQHTLDSVDNVKLNLFECVHSVYHDAKQAGADVRVR
ncbi:hypothetical protein P3342_005370 [Pyrenophora teres f. teres]|nr:hypothetical protein HRS9139_00675 [Pyrenophora teres f. teres]KAE8848249.1 hypothetical protein PTNB85_02092 [Pyrenophora teres f. teres]KAE8853586.1 hypothetical protein HRS9122_00578 [Pyrenophora teres f. teres]KAE8868173.1 hypothetical protein PTNB29_02084 [Pyrenophora teres f. teres]KAE8872939.1 hypothetical protein PTNB73_02090 [Pyrenophora teres f. teres]